MQIITATLHLDNNVTMHAGFCLIYSRYQNQTMAVIVLITCICMAQWHCSWKGARGGGGGGGGGKGAYPASATYDSSMYNHNPSQACMIVYVVVLQNWIASYHAGRVMCCLVNVHTYKHIITQLYTPGNHYLGCFFM